MALQRAGQAEAPRVLSSRVRAARVRCRRRCWGLARVATVADGGDRIRHCPHRVLRQRGDSPADRPVECQYPRAAPYAVQAGVQFEPAAAGAAGLRVIA